MEILAYSGPDGLAAGKRKPIRPLFYPERCHNLKRTSKPGWLKFGFPLMYQTDVLEILDILTALGVKDSRMDEAVSLVVSKQDDRGRWQVENTYNSERLLIPFEQKGAPSKWLTLRAMRVLKRYKH